MEPVVGNCGKHPGQSMIDCPLCAIEKQSQSGQPDQQKGEEKDYRVLSVLQMLKEKNDRSEYLYHTLDDEDIECISEAIESFSQPSPQNVNVEESVNAKMKERLEKIYEISLCCYTQVEVAEITTIVLEALQSIPTKEGDV